MSSALAETCPQAAYDNAIDLLSRMIETPSVSGKEDAVRDLITNHLDDLELSWRMVGKNILIEVSRGSGPTLMLNSHMDTVPANPGYTRDPHKSEIEDGKLYGLGSNDAGASVTCMIHAAAELAKRDDWQGTLQVSIVVEEEATGRNGAEQLVKDIPLPDACVVGEPTKLEVCVAQKGLIVVNCENRGLACHAANAWRLEHKNALLEALEDVRRVEAMAFTERDEALGPTTLNVTVLRGGVATNTIPDKCTWNIDVRVNPAQTLEGVAERLTKELSAEVKPRSLRLHPMRTDPGERVVRAALAARSESSTFGSDTMSDAVFFREVPTIKCGPGMTEMSHRPDEFVEVKWIREGVPFYRDLAVNYFRLAATESVEGDNA